MLIFDLWNRCCQRYSEPTLANFWVNISGRMPPLVLHEPRSAINHGAAL